MIPFGNIASSSRSEDGEADLPLQTLILIFAGNTAATEGSSGNSRWMDPFLVAYCSDVVRSAAMFA